MDICDLGQEFSDEELDEDGCPIPSARKKQKSGESDFLEVGSVSWSIIIAIYFLTLHDDSKENCIMFDSI